MFIKKVLFSLILLFSLSQAIADQPHHTTAFIGITNSLNTLISYSNESADHFWNNRGEKHPTFNKFHRYLYLLYSEYALNSRNSFSLSGGYSRVSESLNGNSQGINDIELGWKFLLIPSKNSAFTTQFLGIIPSGKGKSSYRYGQYGGQIGLLYSQAFCFSQRSGWIDSLLAYRFYGGRPSDQIRGELAIGFNPLANITLIGSGQLEYGIQKNHHAFHVNNITLNPSYKLFKLRLECLINCYPHVNITIGGFQHIWGRNISTGGGLFIGIWIFV